MARKTSNEPETSPDGGPLLQSSAKLAKNALLADIVMRMGTSVLREGVETTFLRGKYGKDAAKALVQERKLGWTLASLAIAKIGSKSIPGAALVGSGLVIKALLDRSKARQAARRNARKANPTSDQSAD